MQLIKVSRSFKKAAKPIKNVSLIPELHYRYWERPYVVGSYANFVRVKEFCEGSVILDVGCGSGWAATLFKFWSCKQVVGLDINPENIMFAKKFRSKENIHFVTGDAPCLSFSDSHFDIVTCFEVIEHVKEWESLINEVKRVLRNGGHFFLSTPNIIHYNKVGYSNPDHVIGFDWDTFSNILGGRLPEAKFYCNYGEDIGAIENNRKVEIIAEKNRIIASIIGRNSDLMSKVVRRFPLRLQKGYFLKKVGICYDWLSEKHLVCSETYRVNGKEPFGFFLHWQKNM